MSLIAPMVDMAVTDLQPMVLDLLVSSLDDQCKGINWVWVASDCPAGGYFEGHAQLETAAPEVVCVYIAQRGVLDVAKYPHMRGIPRYAPSTVWANGGHLLDQYRISFATIGTGRPDEAGNSPIVAIDGLLGNGITSRAMAGKTHLLAACRAVLATHMGDIVRVPAQLVQLP